MYKDTSDQYGTERLGTEALCGGECQKHRDEVEERIAHRVKYAVKRMPFNNDVSGGQQCDDTLEDTGCDHQRDKRKKNGGYQVDDAIQKALFLRLNGCVFLISHRLNSFLACNHALMASYSTRAITRAGAPEPSFTLSGSATI